ncbi:MAG TPA: hypothetical protein VGK73_20685 [Polyangiaceae bacterium]
MTPSIFIACPMHDGWMHHECAGGVLTAMQSFDCTWSPLVGTGLARQRDLLLAKFLESDCTHILWVDSDIGWRAGDAQSLLDTGKDFVAGCYCRKRFGPDIPVNLTGTVEGDLYECTHVPTGFLLVTRAAVERMVEHFRPTMTYRDDLLGRSEVVSLCTQVVGEGTEDLSFCRRWREVGGRIWLHGKIQVGHFDGNTCFMPNLGELPGRASSARLLTPAAAE